MVVSNALFLIGPAIHSPPISERANRLQELGLSNHLISTSRIGTRHVYCNSH